ncbi:hypothetical protein ACFLY4_00380 [Chloroflexota bacterium]
MKKTLQTLFPFLAMCLLGGAIFPIITLIYPPSPLPSDARMWMARTNVSQVQPACSAKPSSGYPCSGEITSGCSVFTVSKGDQVLFGGNDDYINPDSYYWVDPQGNEVIVNSTVIMLTDTALTCILTCVSPAGWL